MALSLLPAGFCVGLVAVSMGRMENVPFEKQKAL
jgi:hypothetical protein